MNGSSPPPSLTVSSSSVTHFLGSTHPSSVLVSRLARRMDLLPAPPFPSVSPRLSATPFFADRLIRSSQNSDGSPSPPLVWSPLSSWASSPLVKKLRIRLVTTTMIYQSITSCKASLQRSCGHSLRTLLSNLPTGFSPQATRSSKRMRDGAMSFLGFEKMSFGISCAGSQALSHTLKCL